MTGSSSCHSIASYYSDAIHPYNLNFTVQLTGNTQCMYECSNVGLAIILLCML